MTPCGYLPRARCATILRRGRYPRYPVASDTGGTGCYEAVEACRVLVSETLGTQCGAARLVLTHVERITGGWAVEFGYCLDGAAVQVYEEGCAARFLVQNGQIAEITLQARSYEETAESGLVLPRLQAMAAMEAAGLEGRELLLGYQDSGGGTVTARLDRPVRETGGEGEPWPGPRSKISSS